MPTTSIPQWVIPAFVRSATAAGATASRAEIEMLASELIAIWAAPERKFHDQHHLVDMLARIDTLASETQDADLIRLAAWGHGIIFTLDSAQVMAHNGGEQELLSAEVATDHYRTIGIPEDKLTRIQDLIRAMHKRHDDGSLVPSSETARFDSIDIDRLALSDAHFGTLAEDPQRYKAYLQAIRAEYAQIDDLHWLRARVAITSRLLARKRIFFSPLAASWEPIARQNLTAELERAKLALKHCEVAVAGEEQDTDAAPVDDASEPSADAEPPVADAESPVADAESPAAMSVASEPEASSSLVREPEASSSLVREPKDFYDEYADDFHVASPASRPQTPRSSLEDFDEQYEPGRPPHILTPEEAEVARRAAISQSTFDAIERRRKEEDEQREAKRRDSSVENEPDF